MSLLIKNIKKEERPRERFLKYGVDNISNEELIAIILRSGTKSKSVRELASEILNLIGDLSSFRELSINRLLSIRGIGQTKAIELISAIEFGKRVFTENKMNKFKLNNPEVIYKSNTYLFQNKKQECFYCFYLNSKYELIERRLLFMGTINKSIVHPREVFKNAYLSSATAIVCMHNHPSGDVTPSKDDIMFTNSLVEIGKIQGIPILDHIIAGDNNYFSFKDNNLIL